MRWLARNMIRLVGTEEVFYQMILFHTSCIIISISYVDADDDDACYERVAFDDGWYGCRRMFIDTT